MATTFEFGIDLVDDRPIDAQSVQRTWNDLERLLSTIESSISGAMAKVHWFVDEPVALTVAASPNGVSASTIEHVIRVAREGFAHAAAEDDPMDWPSELNEDARASVGRILGRLQDLETVIVRATGYQPLAIDAASFSVSVKGKKRVRMRSSVEGDLLTLAHGRNGFELGIRERLSGKYVRCSFDGDLLAKAKDLFDRRVVVEGVVAYNDEGLPSSVSEVTDVYPRLTGLSFRDFRGVVPDLLEGKTLDDFIEEVRG